jgi:hypothetical protein
MNRSLEDFLIEKKYYHIHAKKYVGKTLVFL